MTIAFYFWAALVVLIALAAAMFGIGYGVGSRMSRRNAGIGIGLAILAILALIVGGAKSQEGQIGPLIVYEGAWLASAFNFALAGGYIAGKNRGVADQAKRAIPAVCAVLALGSMFLMAAKLHQLADVLQQLGVGEARRPVTGPDTSLDCKQSLTKIYAGFKHYAEVNDALPPAPKWMAEEDLRGAVQADEWMHCPTVSNRKDANFGYAFNDALAGRKLNGKSLAEMPDAAKTPLVFDSSVLTKSAHDAQQSLPRPGRHGGRNNILYCDGHIDTVKPK